MRQVTPTEKLKAVNEGTFSKKEFVRQMRLQFPDHISQFNGFDDTVQILKNRGLLYEEKNKEQKPTKVDVYDERPKLNYSLDALERGIRVELAAAGFTMPHEGIKSEDYFKAEKKAKENLEKNPTHYLDLMAGESKNVNKHDREVEVKRGKGEIDTINGMKKADLKENYKKVASSILSKYGKLDGIESLIKEYLDTQKQTISEGKLNKSISGFSKFIDQKYSTFLNEGRKKKTQGGKVVTENDYETGGYVEAMGPKFDAAVDRLVAAFDEWKQGPMTEPGMIPHAKKDVVDYIDRSLDSYLEEEKGKDLDKDGDIDSDDYLMARDKAIKKAMGTEEIVKENIKAIITKILSEGTINEAATNHLANFADEYAGFEGMKPAILALENIVTEIEAFYDKTRNKVQKVYDTLGEIRNEEGLKVGGFLAPSIESAFKKDLAPVIRKGFTEGLERPKVRVLSQSELDAMSQQGDIEEDGKQTLFTPNL